MMSESLRISKHSSTDPVISSVNGDISMSSLFRVRTDITSTALNIAGYSLHVRLYGIL